MPSVGRSGEGVLCVWLPVDGGRIRARRRRGGEAMLVPLFLLAGLILWATGHLILR
jgi:hypothetical protein